jgi:hypothetical protein
MVLPLVLLVTGLLLYLPDGHPKRERVGWVLTLIALLVLALSFLNGHLRHLWGRWP